MSNAINYGLNSSQYAECDKCGERYWGRSAARFLNIINRTNVYGQPYYDLYCNRCHRAEKAEKAEKKGQSNQ